LRRHQPARRRNEALADDLQEALDAVTDYVRSRAVSAPDFDPAVHDSRSHVGPRAHENVTVAHYHGALRGPLLKVIYRAEAAGYASYGDHKRPLYDANTVADIWRAVHRVNALIGRLRQAAEGR
jgi:hypothetical protein